MTVNLPKAGSRFRLLGLVMTLLLVIGPNQTLDAKAPGDCLLTWEVVSSPNMVDTDNFLSGVAVLDTYNVWVVGSYGDGSSGIQSSIFHWDGNTWAAVAHPNVPDGLHDIQAISASDIWAVGGSRNADDPTQSVGNALHWDGSEWQVVPGLERGGTAISITDTNDVWMTGNDLAIYHWNGVSFDRMPIIATPLPNQSLADLKVFGNDDLWVVGNWSPGSIGFRSVVYHWNGSDWIRPDLPELQNTAIYSVDGVSSAEPWVAGRTDSSFAGLMYRLKGDTWQAVATPKIAAGTVSFNDLLLERADHGWAVGSLALSFPNAAPLIEHWNGKKWMVNPLPTLDSDRAGLSAVDMLSDSEGWAVGTLERTDHFESFVLHGHLPCVAPPSATARPKLVAPKDGAVVKNTVTLVWRQVILATSYQVQVWMNGQTHPVQYKVTEATELKIKGLVPYRSGYRWRVRACDATGCGPWSKVRTFSSY